MKTTKITKITSCKKPFKYIADSARWSITYGLQVRDDERRREHWVREGASSRLVVDPPDEITRKLMDRLPPKPCLEEYIHPCIDGVDCCTSQLSLPKGSKYE